MRSNDGNGGSRKSRSLRYCDEGGGWRSGAKRGGRRSGRNRVSGVEITAGQAILSGQEQKDDPARRITRDAPRCPVKLIRELLFNGEHWPGGGPDL